LGSIDLERAMLKQFFEQNPTNRKVVEQSLNLTEKLFKSTKGKVERLKGQNETLIKKIHK
jgi:phage-related minor tail protein